MIFYPCVCINIHSFNSQLKKKTTNVRRIFIKKVKIFRSNNSIISANFNFPVIYQSFWRRKFLLSRFLKKEASENLSNPRRCSIPRTEKNEIESPRYPRYRLNNAIGAFEPTMESPLYNHLHPFHDIITMKSNCSSLSISNPLESMYNFQQRQLLSPTISINLN